MSEPVLRAHRIVLAAVLDREEAAACIGAGSDVVITRWPSSLYGVLAAAAIRSPLVWRRCARLVDASLGDLVPRFEALPPIALAQRFADGRDVLPCRELTALLWCLLRRRDPALDVLSERLGAELEIVAVRRVSEDVEAAHVPRLGLLRSTGGAPGSC